MKQISTLIFFVLFLITIPLSSSNAQLQRNVVLEYCTGVWCQWCPCGHAIIRDEILPAFPNTIVIGYHGPANSSSEPFSFFSGNSIISALGFSSYPTGIVDRTSAPISRGLWLSTVSSRNSVNATVDINVLKTYNASTRVLDLTVKASALENLTGNFYVNVILTEDELKYPQTGNSSCAGGTEYSHSHVVRSMLNGASGEMINVGGSWLQGVELQKDYSLSIPAGIYPANSHIIVMIYKQGSTMNTGNIQQAKHWTVPGDIVPVEFSAFTASLEGKGIILSWETATEKNNLGFAVERSTDGINYSSVGFVSGKGTTAERQIYSFLDNPEASGIFFYRLKQQDYNGNFSYSEVITVKLDVPLEFALAQNYPNPFNPSTLIYYSLPVESFVTLSVYDLMGREVASLVSEVKKAGTYEIEFNAANLASGTYIYKITAGNFIETRKLMVLK